MQPLAWIGSPAPISWVYNDFDMGHSDPPFFARFHQHRYRSTLYLVVNIISPFFPFCAARRCVLT